MKHILASLVFAACAVSATDTPVAIVKGTNVLGTAVVDMARFDPTKIAVGASNVVVSTAEVGVVQPGWTLVNGEFRDKTGATISNGTKNRIDRAKLIDAAISELNAMQVSGANAVANWASLSAAQKDAAQKTTIQAGVRCSQIIELLLREQRALLELKETTQ